MKNALLLACICALSGCASMNPHKAQNPPQNYTVEADSAASGLPAAKNFEEAIDKALKYETFYSKLADIYYRKDFSAGEVRTYANLAAVAAGLFEELDWAIGFAGVGTLTETIENRYQAKAQGAIFRKASNVFAAMRQDMASSELRGSFGTYKSSDINGIIEKVRMAMHSRRSELTVEVPSIEAIRQAFKESEDAERAYHDSVQNAVEEAEEQRDLADEQLAENAHRIEVLEAQYKASETPTPAEAPMFQVVNLAQQLNIKLLTANQIDDLQATASMTDAEIQDQAEQDNLKLKLDAFIAKLDSTASTF